MITLTFTGGGKDYTSGPYSVSIPAGQLENFFSISIHDDYQKEDHENFTVNIDQSSLPCRITVVNPSEAVVNIEDDRECVSVICNMEGLGRDSHNIVINIHACMQ